MPYVVLLPAMILRVFATPYAVLSSATLPPGTSASGAAEEVLPQGYRPYRPTRVLRDVRYAMCGTDTVYGAISRGNGQRAGQLTYLPTRMPGHVPYCHSVCGSYAMSGTDLAYPDLSYAYATPCSAAFGRTELAYGATRVRQPRRRIGWRNRSRALAPYRLSSTPIAYGAILRPVLM
eukprot:3940375-Rhodomonas_salina.7